MVADFARKEPQKTTGSGQALVRRGVLAHEVANFSTLIHVTVNLLEWELSVRNLHVECIEAILRDLKKPVLRYINHRKRAERSISPRRFSKPLFHNPEGYSSAPW